MHKRILITGATGLIGSELVRQCHGRDIDVHYLTTSKGKIENKENYKGFYWNPKKNELDEKAFHGVTAIVHLAGATISKRWTKRYKKIIIESRVEPANLLYATLKKIPHKITHFISASGINVYPTSLTKLYVEEDSEKADSFLGEVVDKWETAARQFKTIGMDVAEVRTGMVLAAKEGALPKLVLPEKYWLGAPLASGEQWYSWIHIYDIAGIYLFILNNELEGIYNAVAPTPVMNKKMIKQIAQQLDKPLVMPHIPAFLLKLFLGDMAILVTEGTLVSSHKLEEVGYTFKFYNIEMALHDLLQKRSGT